MGDLIPFRQLDEHEFELYNDTDAVQVIHIMREFVGEDRVVLEPGDRVIVKTPRFGSMIIERVVDTRAGTAPA